VIRAHPHVRKLSVTLLAEKNTKQDLFFLLYNYDLPLFKFAWCLFCVAENCTDTQETATTRNEVHSELCSRLRGGILIVTDAVKTIKLTIRLIGRHHPRSSFLPHVDTGPTVPSNFGTLPGSTFLSECQTLSAIWAGSPQLYQTSVLSALFHLWK
jgi:hypothetical protein